MSALVDAPARRRPRNGGLPARRAIVRWAWRLLRREWRQQLLIWALITTAVAITTVGVGVSTNTPLSSYVGFGTAHDMATFSGVNATEAADVARWHRDYGALDIIENERLAVPGSIDTFDLRAQNPHGAYGASLLAVVRGHFPTLPDEVAMTPQVASALGVSIGSNWRHGAVVRRVVGIVENPEDLLDQFALVLPGQVPPTSQVTVLFDAPGVSPHTLGPAVQTTTSVASGNALNPDTISIVLVTLAMLLISLVAVAGFTVQAQRRMRSMGMLAAIGATDRRLKMVVRVNGLLVGVTGALAGVTVGLVAWLAYRPVLENSAHHVVGVWQLPWGVVVTSMLLAVAGAYAAAMRPARTMSHLSIVDALAGRPATPKKLRRTALPGLIVGAVAFFVLGAAGASGGRGNGVLELVVGVVLLIVAMVLLAPFVLVLLSRVTRRSALALRMATRDLSRYRARSGSALAAISVGVFVAVIVIVASAARFSNVLDWAGPNVSSSQVIVYTSNGPYGVGGPGNGTSPEPANLSSLSRAATAIAASLGARDLVELQTTSATLQHAAPGRSYSGPLYVATPQLLAAFHLSASSVRPTTDILSMRPGFATLSDMQVVYGNYFSGGHPTGHGAAAWPCPATDCLARPTMQEESSLPAGTSAPNTVITEHAVHLLGLSTSVSGWFIQLRDAPTALQISDARRSASLVGLSIETKSSIPTSATIVDWATLVGMLLALGILMMTIGLIRSESAGDMRILNATGASARTRRNLAACSAGSLALAGSVVGTVAGYVALIAFSRTNNLDGLSSLINVPVVNMLLIVVGMPAIAALGSWLTAGRESVAVGRRAID